MKKMLISEDEKSRILNLHQNLGYKTSLNEQSVPQSVPQKPQPNVQKPTESLDSYFTIDPTGKKIASISPIFVKWSINNKIQESRAKYQVNPNNRYESTAVGTDGKTYKLNLMAFELSKGNIPQDSEEKLKAASSAIRQKVVELNTGQVAYAKCFNLNSYPPKKNNNSSSSSNSQCTTAYNDYDIFKKSTDYDYYYATNEILNFLSVAPKFQPKQG